MITWQQLTINSNKDYSEQITTWLNLLEAKVIESHPDSHSITALFLPEAPIKQIKLFLQKNINTPLIFSTQFIQDDDWHKTQALNLTPIEINQQFAIYPNNYMGDISHDTPVYIHAIDAFGTGKHPTTFQCLQWLASQNLQNKSIIDFGCGSGILAIAALIFGAKNTWAIDIDIKALKATENNAKLNHINSSQLHINTTLLQSTNSILRPEIGSKPESEPGSCGDKIKADIIIANIFANPLCELASLFYEHLKPNGTVILAGMLAEQRSQVLSCYRQYFSINEINILDGWPLLLAKKN